MFCLLLGCELWSCIAIPLFPVQNRFTTSLEASCEMQVPENTLAKKSLPLADAKYFTSLTISSSSQMTASPQFRHQKDSKDPTPYRCQIYFLVACQSSVLSDWLVLCIPHEECLISNLLIWCSWHYMAVQFSRVIQKSIENIAQA